ncbi:MAG: fructokinase [Pseudomonadota bacterium]
MRIGIDLGGTKIEGIALDDDGQERIRRRVSTPKEDYDGTVRTIIELARSFESELGTSATLGIGMPGAISPQTGLVKNANSTWLIGRTFDKDLMAAWGREVRCANDANCLAVSEAVDGAAAGAEVVFAVIIGTGTGAGIAINGRAHTGQNAIAGEFGHIPLPWAGPEDDPPPPCYCGKKGCLETYISGTGFEKDYAKVVGDRIPGSAIMVRAMDGEKEALATLDRYESRLARGLAVVINVLDPDVVVLGGGMSNIERLYDAMPKLLPQWVFGGEVATPVRQSKHGDSSGVRGAAWLWGKGETDGR